jgi:threonine synthase
MMRFKTVAGKSPPVGFREALFQGLAPDGSLYVPDHIPPLDKSFLDNLASSSLQSAGLHVASSFIDEIPRGSLEKIVERAFSFPVPLVRLEEGFYVLELFHGPTLAFKDVGARFMAEVLSYFLSERKQEVTILVATSGDTGSAVAHGFFNVPHITVYILYPSGKISRLQEQQMTTLGGNIHAVEVEGTFDDCQRLVKQTFSDLELCASGTLTTANSINLGRLLPQISYYVWGVAQLMRESQSNFAPPLVVVPSGNVGNLTAAVYAKWMGVPIHGFVAATNANDVLQQYLVSGEFIPHPSVQTFSNAMDVGNPSNLARVQALYKNDVAKLRKDIDVISISDKETLNEIKRTYDTTGYLADPHTAVGLAAARRVHERGKNLPPLIVLSTAHPAKFPHVIEQAIGAPAPVHPALQSAMQKPKQSVGIRAEYEKWRAVLAIG